MSEGLKQIDPRPCEINGCRNTAHWRYNETAVCREDMEIMSDMNSDNKEVFALALAHMEAE